MSVLLPGTLGDIHQSVKNDWFVDGAKWFDVDTMQLGKTLKDVYKNYKNYIHRGKQQGNFANENFTYGKMKEKFSEILSKNVVKAPKPIKLNIPKPKSIKLPKKPKLKTV